MRAKITYFVTAAVLVVYFVLVGSRGWLLVQQGTFVTVALGVTVFVLPFIGLWFLWHTTRFATQSGRLARELEAEGGLPVDELERTSSGRIVRESADVVFAERKAEAEADPQNWRTWFRLAVAYHDARDTPRARKAMEHAIRLHRDASRSGTPTCPPQGQAEGETPASPEDQAPERA